MTAGYSALLFLILSLLSPVASDSDATEADGNPQDLDGEPAEPVLDTLILPRSLFPHERSNFRTMRETVRNLAERSGKHGQDAWEVLRATNRAQIPLPEDTQFPCAPSPQNPLRSRSPPTSVHRLRPGDIDVVGAMGDSLTAGSGVLATNPLQVYIEDRGVSFPIGGELSWREALTIPNILKQFNPKLRGYSDGSAFSYEPASRLNVAEPAARTTDMLHQAKLLVRRMRADKAIQIEKHWKSYSPLEGVTISLPLTYEVTDKLSSPAAGLNFKNNATLKAGLIDHSDSSYSTVYTEVRLLSRDRKQPLTEESFVLSRSSGVFSKK